MGVGAGVGAAFLVWALGRASASTSAESRRKLEDSLAARLQAARTSELEEKATSEAEKQAAEAQLRAARLKPSRQGETEVIKRAKKDRLKRERLAQIFLDSVLDKPPSWLYEWIWNFLNTPRQGTVVVPKGSKYIYVANEQFAQFFAYHKDSDNRLYSLDRGQSVVFKLVVSPKADEKEGHQRFQAREVTANHSRERLYSSSTLSETSFAVLPLEREITSPPGDYE